MKIKQKFPDKLSKFICSVTRTVFTPSTAARRSPAEAESEAELTNEEKRHAAALMRVNHCGEVCAQALYLGQSLFSRDQKIREALQKASEEETDHLVWTATRINELGGRQSLLNPIWYAGAFSLGAAAAIVSDKVSLGFVAETENQVSAHLQSHLDKLPVQDKKSRAVVAQMDEDERQHATNALQMGGVPLPFPARKLMALFGRVMTGTSYRL